MRRRSALFSIRSAALGLVGLLAVVLAGCGRDLPQSPFDPKGPVARMQLELLSFTMWMALAILAVVTAVVVYTAIRFRQRPGQQGEPAQIHGNTWLEIAWTAIPILILATLAVPTVQAAFATASPGSTDVLKVRAVGNQWWWAFEYPELGFVTANELRIPVGKKVLVELVSNDVIHALWVPKLAGKVDVIPGRVNTLWLEADEAGTYFGQCAEFCGESHAKMRFRVEALDKAAFDQYVAGRQARPAATQQPLTGPAARGQQIFAEQKQCWSCHAIDGSAKAKGVAGPNLTDVGSRRTIAAGWLDNTADNLKQWIRDPQSIKPGAKMVPHPDLTEDDLDALVAFLQSQR